MRIYSKSLEELVVCSPLLIQQFTLTVVHYYSTVQSRKFRIYDFYVGNMLRIVISLRNCA